MLIDKNIKEAKLENAEIKRIMSEGGVLWEKNTVPGPSKLIGGNLQAGFYGEVSTSDFITGDELAKRIGLSAGVSQFSNEPWLKFSYLGKTEFIAKKTFRHSISWDSINDVNAVYGNRTIEINGNIYKVRLVKGKNEGLQKEQKKTYKELYYSEWNKLMLPIHKNAPSSFDFKLAVIIPTENWNVGYTDVDLLTTTENKVGYNTWCQGVGDQTYEIILRGGGSSVVSSDVSFTNCYPSGVAWDNFGWRPVLELVD